MDVVRRCELPSGCGEEVGGAQLGCGEEVGGALWEEWCGGVVILELCVEGWCEGMREGVVYHCTPLMLGWRVTSRR